MLTKNTKLTARSQIGLPAHTFDIQADLLDMTKEMAVPMQEKPFYILDFKLNLPVDRFLLNFFPGHHSLTHTPPRIC
jgi:hypothetical protein